MARGAASSAVPRALWRGVYVEPFAQVEDVQRRLDFELDDQERRAVSLALQDLSDEARFIAGRQWADVERLPNPVRNIVIKATARWAKNMHGNTVSRAGDEVLQWPSQGREAGAPEFTSRERQLIRALGDGHTGQPFFATVELYAHIPPRDIEDEWIPVEGAGFKPFPFNQPGGGW